MKLSAMRFSCVVLAAIVLENVPSGFGAESIAWGQTVDGLRLGAAYGLDPSIPTLRIALQNVGPEPQELVVGHTAGWTIYDSLEFVATAPNGQQQLKLLHRSVYRPLAGLVLPLSVHLSAGESHELELPLNDMIHASRTTVTLDDLVKHGYSVRVLFRANQSDASWAKLSHPWIGMLSSPEISPTRQSGR